MPTSSTNFGLLKPLVNNATDADLWGGQLNGDLDSLDGLLLTALNLTPSVQTSTITVTAMTAASTNTGSNRVLYLCNATGGAFAANLPAVATASGLTVAFKKTDSSNNAITITGNSTDNIDGSNTLSLAARYAYVVIQCDGTKWNIISQTAPAVSVFTGDSGSGGTTGTVPAPPAGSAAANEVLGAGGAWISPPFTKTYNSGAQAYSSGGTLTLAHGLGVVPKFLSLFMTCTTTDQGYSVGAVMYVPCGALDVNNANGGCTVLVDATNLYVKFGVGTAGAGFATINLSTGDSARMAFAKWTATFEAYA